MSTTENLKQIIPVAKSYRNLLCVRCGGTGGDVEIVT